MPPDGGEPAQSRRRERVALQGWLLGLTLALFLVQGISRPGRGQQVVVTALAGLILVLAFRAARARPALITAVTALAVATVATSLLTGDEGAVGVMNAAVTALGPPAIAVSIVRGVRLDGRIRISAVSGVLALYLLMGMCFSFVYGALDRLGDQPFFTGGDSATVSHCLYFSFITLTTVGYGDFTAATDTGHTLSALEALFGQIYLVTIVALIVGNLGRPTNRAR
jgi:hypothetical protein